VTPGDALAIAVQVAVALAGFTGVVVVFGSSAVHEWRRLDKFRLRLLLATSTLPLTLCLLAILLLVTNSPPDMVWRIMSGISACFYSTAILLALREFQRISTSELNQSSRPRIVFYPVSSAGAALVILMIYNTIALGAFWPFFAAIIFSMMAAVLQFIRLISLQPGRHAE
jgi:hypothetical protein